MDLFIQLLGFLGMGLTLSSFQLRSQKMLIRIQLFASLVFAVHYLLLGAATGAVLNLIGIGRAFVFSNREKQWAQHRGWVILFSGAYFAVYLAGFLLPEQWNPALELLPVIGSLATTVGFRLDNITMRRLALVNGVTWVVYAIFCGSVGGALTEGIGILSVLIGLWRLKKK